MLHNAPSLDLSSIILFWKKSRKIDHESWIDTELIWNLIFPFLSEKSGNKWNAQNKGESFLKIYQIYPVYTE